MLVLSRKTDESIIINGEIRVKILAISGNKVRIGIEAPNDVPIRREEILINAEPLALPRPANRNDALPLCATETVS